MVGRGYCRVPQHFPQPGWVEQEPADILSSVQVATAAALHDSRSSIDDVAAIGIANQRETTLVWDRHTGRPLYRAIVWQDRRTAERCRELPADLIRARTGLVPDPYFSATKLEWLLSHVDTDIDRGNLACGTVDSWLVWNLTRGDCYVTDVSNASRTLLFDIHRLQWDNDLLALFGVDRELLPEVIPSSGPLGTAFVDDQQVPICGLAGDQQAALIGQACIEAGQGKATYGTGGFVLVNGGMQPEPPPPGLLLTVATQTGPGRPAYALEGSILSVGAAIDWLTQGLELIETPAQADLFARSVENNGAVYFVPALTGLGSPHWAPNARGTIVGLTRGTSRAHIARAALEAIAYQTRDIIDLMPVPLTALRVDGGVTASTFAMQFLADLLGVPIHAAAEREATAVGAAALAAIGCDLLPGPEALTAKWRCSISYQPAISRDEADAGYHGWTQAVERTLMTGTSIADHRMRLTSARARTRCQARANASGPDTGSWS